MERELGLAAAPAPFALDAGAVCRRVERTLSAEQAGRKCYMKHKCRLAAVLAAAMIAVTGTAFAAGPYVDQALENALGSFLSYAQPLEGAAEDQGIQFRVVSALTDGAAVRIYAEVTDLTGDRLANAQFRGRVELSSEEYMMGTSGISLIGYDAEHKTALICIREETNIQLSEMSEGVVYLSSIQPEYYDVCTGPVPAENIPDFYLETQTVENGKTVLCPGQNPAELENGNGVSVSSMGFAADGRLHFLIRFPEGTSAGTYRAFIPSAIESTDSADEQSVYFSQDGVSYYDHSVTGDLSARDSIKELSGVFGFYNTAELLTGKWTLPVRLEQVEHQTSPISGAIGDLTLCELSLSPLSVMISYSGEGMLFYPVTVFLSDGSRLRLENKLLAFADAETIHTNQWDFTRPVEVNDITGVALGQWMIPVENGTAGAGYWLDEAPEATE